MFDDNELLLIGAAVLKRMVEIRERKAISATKSNDHRLYEMLSEVVYKTDQALSSDDRNANPYWDENDRGEL